MSSVVGLGVVDLLSNFCPWVNKKWPNSKMSSVWRKYGIRKGLLMCRDHQSKVGCALVRSIEVTSIIWCEKMFHWEFYKEQFAMILHTRKLRPVYTFWPRLRSCPHHHQVLSLCQWWRVVWQAEWVCPSDGLSLLTQCKLDGDCDGDGHSVEMCKQAFRAPHCQGCSDVIITLFFNNWSRHQ